MTVSCKHTKCAVCGGFRLKSAYVGNTKLSDICSPKCQMATKDACSCKCEGYFHKGSHKKEMDAILNPKKKKKPYKKRQVNKSSQKYLISNFEPWTIKDEIALFIGNTKIEKQSFARFGDKNYIDRQLSRNWLTNKKGAKLDQLAQDYINDSGREDLDGGEVIQTIIDIILESPGGYKNWLKDRVKEQQEYFDQYNIQEDDQYFYVPEDYEFDFPAPAPEDLFINGIKNTKMIKLKKGSAEAKKFMAKLRSMKGKMTAKKSIKKVDSKKINLNTLQEKYRENEDYNLHSENILLLAKNFGSKTDLNKANDLIKLRDKQGYLTSDQKSEGYKIHKKLIKKLFPTNVGGVKKIGATKLSEKQLIKIASDYAYVTSSDEDRAIYRLTDPDFTNVLLPKYKKAIKDWEKKNKIKINVGGIKTKAKSRTTKKIKFNPKNLNANQDKYKYMNKYYEIHEDMDGEGYLSVPGGTIYFTGIGAVKKAKSMARASKIHKDTKSHNVNIRVMSGLKKISGIPHKSMYFIEYTDGNGINKVEYFDKKPIGIYYAEGYQNKEDKGKAYLTKLTNKGTSLIPLMVSKTNKQYKKRS
jgi:hypothetical protein